MWQVVGSVVLETCRESPLGKTKMNEIKSLGLILILILACACGDDDEVNPDASAPQPDAAVIPTTDAAPPDAAVDPAIRGQYLVDHVSLCIDCHTPRKVDGSLDMDNYLAGAECFIDIDPTDVDVGCLHTRNLTNHATGLMNRTDVQIKAMFLDGLRPNGSALIPVMPYWSFHNITSEDADAIVAYLRTVTGVDHAVPANQAPWVAPASPATAIDTNDIPVPPAGPDFDSATRGRYLAAFAGVCMECHTPELDPATSPPRPMDVSMPFAGNRPFPGLPSPPFDTTLSHSANLTQHATGLDGWTVADIKKVIQMGVDPDDDVICPPMPAGPMGAFGGLTDADVTDIANYVVSLPAIDNEVVGTCSLLP